MRSLLLHRPGFDGVELTNLVRGLGENRINAARDKSPMLDSNPPEVRLLLVES